MGKEELFLNSKLRPQPLSKDTIVYLGNKEDPITTLGGIKAAVVSYDMLTFGAASPANLAQVEAEMYQRVFQSWGAKVVISEDRQQLWFIKYGNVVKIHCGFQESCLKDGKALAQPIRDTLTSLMLLPKEMIAGILPAGLVTGKVKRISFQDFLGIETIALSKAIIGQLGLTIPALQTVKLEENIIYPLRAGAISLTVAQQEQFHPFAAILKQIAYPTNSHPVRPDQNHSWRNK